MAKPRAGDFLWPRPELTRLLHRYNRQYFQNRLPREIEVCWCAMSDGSEFGRTIRIGNGFLILLFRPESQHQQTLNLTLLHEMAHIDTWDEAQHHGPRWKAAMRRLARAGAFDRWW